MIAGIVVGAVVLVAIVVFLLKSGVEGGSSSKKRGYDDANEGSVQLDQLFLNDDSHRQV
jgi:hypothetical protein